MGASPYIDQETRIVALGAAMRANSKTALNWISRKDPSGDRRAAAHRELLRRGLFAKPETSK